MPLDSNEDTFRLSDRLQIQDVVYRWCRSVDRRDWVGALDCFHPDGTDDHGIFNGPIADFVEFLKPRHEAVPTYVHRVANIIIDFVDDDEAIVESTTQGLQRKVISDSGPDELPYDPTKWTVTHGRYVDRFQRRDGKWKILSRTVAFDALLTVDDGGSLPGTFIPSTRDGNDPLWQRHQEMGLTAPFQTAARGE